MALLPGDDGPYVFESDLPPEAAGRALLDYMAGRFAYQERGVWERRIRAGDVRLDGDALTDPEARLPSRGRMAYVHGAYLEPEVPTGWRVLYAAEDWLAVEKPAGMPVHSTPRIFRQALVWQVRKLFGDDWAPVHRLDRDTSGLVLFARGSVALPHLNACFAGRMVGKTYLALVHGRPRDEFEIDAPLGRSGDPEIPMRVGVRGDGKEARTRVRVLGADLQSGGTWVQASPLQGRLHQIRVHLELSGHPIVGDLLYDGAGGRGFRLRAQGASAEEIRDAVGAERMWLHAWRLDFPLPEPGMPRRLECPLDAARWTGVDDRVRE